MEPVKEYAFCQLYVAMYWVNEQYIAFKSKIIGLKLWKAIFHIHSKILITGALAWLILKQIVIFTTYYVM